MEVGGAEFAVKQYARGSAGARLRRLLRGSRARAAGRRYALWRRAGLLPLPPLGLSKSPAWLEPESLPYHALDRRSVPVPADAGAPQSA